MLKIKFIRFPFSKNIGLKFWAGDGIRSGLCCVTTTRYKKSDQNSNHQITASSPRFFNIYRLQ